MQPRTFKNFQCGDHIRSKQGEVFEIVERETFYCKGCECNLKVCDKFKERTTLWIKSQRGIWEITLKDLNTKFVNHDCDEVTYKNGQWK